jgi:hypothetical protein
MKTAFSIVFGIIATIAIGMGTENHGAYAASKMQMLR